MNDDYAMTPRQAIEVVQATGAEDAAKLIGDHAAAGLVRSYAQVQLTIDAAGQRTSRLGARIDAEVWERMIRAGVDGDAWTGGTVRLPGSDLVGGEPAMNITGIAFHPADIHRLALQQRPTPQPSRKAKQQPSPSPADETDAKAPSKRKRKAPPDLSPLHSGAIHLTVEQTKAALSIGHTTFYKLLNAGKLERAPSKTGTRIMAASVRRYAGLSA